MDIANILRKVPLFANLSAEHLEHIARKASRRRYRRGDLIIREGTPDKRLFVVASGEVQVIKAWGEKHERLLQTFRGHVHFGEMALIDDMDRSASVIAAAATEVLTIEQGDFRQVLRDNAEVALDLLRTLSWRLRSMNKSISDTLGMMAPVCMVCHRINDSGRGWVSMERYVQDHSEIESNHSLCPACSRKKFPDFYQ